VPLPSCFFTTKPRRRSLRQGSWDLSLLLCCQLVVDLEKLRLFIQTEEMKTCWLMALLVHHLAFDAS